MKCTVVVRVSSSVLNGCYSIKRHTCISHHLNLRNEQSMVLCMKITYSRKPVTVIIGDWDY